MINGLLKPTHGTVLIDGMDTKDYTTAQLSKIAGYVFQNPDDQIFHIMSKMKLDLDLKNKDYQKKKL